MTAGPLSARVDEPNDDWWTALHLAAADAVDHVPYAAASEYPVPHTAAFRSAVEPFLAPLLATVRDLSDAIDKARALAGEWEALADDLGWPEGIDPRNSAARLRAVLPADHEQPTDEEGR